MKDIELKKISESFPECFGISEERAKELLRIAKEMYNCDFDGNGKTDLEHTLYHVQKLEDGINFCQTMNERIYLSLSFGILIGESGAPKIQIIKF